MHKNIVNDDDLIDDVKRLLNIEVVFLGLSDQDVSEIHQFLLPAIHVLKKIILSHRKSYRDAFEDMDDKYFISNNAVIWAMAFADESLTVEQVRCGYAQIAKCKYMPSLNEFLALCAPEIYNVDYKSKFNQMMREQAERANYDSIKNHKEEKDFNKTHCKLLYNIYFELIKRVDEFTLQSNAFKDVQADFETVYKQLSKSKELKDMPVKILQIEQKNYDELGGEYFDDKDYLAFNKELPEKFPAKKLFSLNGFAEYLYWFKAKMQEFAEYKTGGMQQFAINELEKTNKAIEAYEKAQEADKKDSYKFINSIMLIKQSFKVH